MNFQKQKNVKNIYIYNNFLVSKKIIQDCNTVVYYWPKSKDEAKFQVMNIISCCTINTLIFIVGNNSCGVKSASLILKDWIDFKIIDKARHSILIMGFLKKTVKFKIEDFFKIHTWKGFYIKSLPGVFGYKKIDEGSQLLASTFSKNIKGKVLDIGSGTGFLSVCLLYFSPNIDLTLTDNSIVALKCSKETLDINQLKAKIIISDVYSNILEKFDLIVSNPPFHKDLKVNFNVAKKIILHAKNFLNKQGELRFVTNNNNSCEILLRQNFKKYSLIEKNNKYKVYQAFLK
ncbi:16S rRNA methyltransferase [Buchnera aphidicola (Diuraphis noxia)]|uniref:16S rRNA methyltransferase n=1 Tax=Buchnera aphidicola subsp. Diuraphis noxia TaxID=118101 RepID=A0A1B2H995_BUCDN|nr:16S rRNA methyltransferase [Buchnera aphidicola (Diuraphis noxia)]